MNTGLQRFEYFLQQVEVLLTKASKQKNAAAWLYKNNARTPFFMLEGLAKMYAELHLKKYATTEILKSPFNTFPKTDDNKNLIELNKGYFLALSWVIAKLGSLKDEGLIVTGLKEALPQTTSCTDDEAYAKAYSILGKKYKKLQVILDEAEVITKTFFAENNLENLLSKVS